MRNETVSEYNRLKAAWAKWNKNCHPDDKIDWNEWLDEHYAYEKRFKKNDE
jgi:hypothetical protein